MTIAHHILSIDVIAHVVVLIKDLKAKIVFNSRIWLSLSRKVFFKYKSVGNYFGAGNMCMNIVRTSCSMELFWTHFLIRLFAMSLGRPGSIFSALHTVADFTVAGKSTNMKN